MFERALFTRSGWSPLRARWRAVSNSERARSRSPFRSEAHPREINFANGSATALRFWPIGRTLCSLLAAVVPRLPLDELDEVLDFVARAGRQVPERLEELALGCRELARGSLVKELPDVHFEDLQDLEEAL